MNTRAGDAGALAGLGAGTVMWLCLMCWTASRGQGFWPPLQLVAGTFLGVSAVLGGAAAGVLGAALHLLASAFWGLLFGALVDPYARPRQVVWGGLLYGAAVWLVMSFSVLPVLDPVMGERMALMPGAWFACHLVYGACLTITPRLRRAREALPVVEEPLRPFSETETPLTL
jgi:hypothetical protein